MAVTPVVSKLFHPLTPSYIISDTIVQKNIISHIILSNSLHPIRNQEPQYNRYIEPKKLDD